MRQSPQSPHKHKGCPAANHLSCHPPSTAMQVEICWNGFEMKTTVSKQLGLWWGSKKRWKDCRKLSDHILPHWKFQPMFWSRVTRCHYDFTRTKVVEEQPAPPPDDLKNPSIKTHFFPHVCRFSGPWISGILAFISVVCPHPLRSQDLLLSTNHAWTSGPPDDKQYWWCVRIGSCRLPILCWSACNYDPNLGAVGNRANSPFGASYVCKWMVRGK